MQTTVCSGHSDRVGRFGCSDYFGRSGRFGPFRRFGGRFGRFVVLVVLIVLVILVVLLCEKAVLFYSIPI